uniref:Uncharacterized protein n=1 Tax=Micrurus surinamensis TaxID=129470 RepID=A0A2D4NM45_MICSU
MAMKNIHVALDKLDSQKECVLKGTDPLESLERDMDCTDVESTQLTPYTSLKFKPAFFYNSRNLSEWRSDELVIPRRTEGNWGIGLSHLTRNHCHLDFVGKIVQLWSLNLLIFN